MRPSLLCRRWLDPEGTDMTAFALAFAWWVSGTVSALAAMKYSKWAVDKIALKGSVSSLTRGDFIACCAAGLFGPATFVGTLIYCGAATIVLLTDCADGWLSEPLLKKGKK